MSKKLFFKKYRSLIENICKLMDLGEEKFLWKQQYLVILLRNKEVYVNLCGII